MTDQSDYRKYLESKFDSLHEKLDTIVNQVKKTNGTIIDLEKEDRRIENKLDDSMRWAHHVVDSRVSECPLLPRIEDIEEGLEKSEENMKREVNSLREELFEWRFFKKYPKLSFVIVTLIVASMLLSAVNALNSINSRKTSKEMIEMQKQAIDDNKE